MGALLTQAVANQLRQVPGFMAQPSPPVLLQQILNEPGASRPMWQAPVMENQQLLATGMDPNLSPAYRDAINQALARNATAAAISFGGADITKEERLKWEKENEEYRKKQTEQEKTLPVGTRVAYIKDPHTADPKVGARRGTVIDPTPELKRGGSRVILKQPDDPADWVMVEFDPITDPKDRRYNTPPYWPQWLHRDWLDILPPEYKYRLAPASWIDRVNVSPPDPEHGRPQFWFDDPETAEKANVLRNVGPPFKLRQRSMPKNIVRVQEPVPTPPPGQGVGVKYRSTLMNWKPEDIEVEIRDNVWIPLTEWMKGRK